MLAVVLAVVTLVRRWRHEDALLRQRVASFAIAFAVPVVLFPLGHRRPARPPGCSPSRRSRCRSRSGWRCSSVGLYDVQLALNRSITVLAHSSVLIAGLYAVVVGGVGAMLRTERCGLAARGSPPVWSR